MDADGREWEEDFEPQIAQISQKEMSDEIGLAVEAN